MNPTTPLGELLLAIAEGLARPRHSGSALVIVLALAGAWALAHWLGPVLARRRATGAAAGVAPAAPAGKAATPLAPGPRTLDDTVLVLRRLLFPLLALLLLWLGEGILRLRHVIAGPADARLLRLAMSLVGTLAGVRLLFALLRRVFHHSQLNAMLERLIGALAVLGIVLYATGAWDDAVTWLATSEIPLGTNARVTLWSLMIGGATTLVALLAAMWLGSLIEERLAVQTGLEPNLRIVLGRVARALLLVFALLLALALSGIDLTVLSVFGGALGVGLGLGLQRIASNYVSGFILLLDRSLRIGDIVAIDKYYGQVTQISTRCTVLRAADGTEAVIPNEMLVSAVVVNYTLGDRRLCLAVPVAVAPETDLARARELLCAAAREVPRVLAQPAPTAILKEIQGGNLVLEVDFWIADPELGRQNVQSDVAIAALRHFAEAGIRLAVPRGEFHLDGAPGAERRAGTAVAEKGN